MAGRKLSLCMIVKDEEGQLGRCLASARDVVDEIIVVDTGSTDRTPTIAAEFGAKVIHYPWDGSFSSARNVSLEHATGDWILILDADEALADGSLLRSGWDRSDDTHEAYILPLVNFVGDRAQEEAVTAPSVRLFRNRPEHRFSRALHEQIMAAILAARPAATCGYLPEPIEHYGYLNALIIDKDKIARNLALARAEVERYPEDAFSWYNLGQEHFRMARWEEAVDAYQRGFPYLESLAVGYAPALVKHLCVALLSLERADAALQVADQALEAYPDFTDLRILRGLALMQRHELEAACAEFEAALALGEVHGGFYISDEGVGSYKAHWWLGRCRLELGDLPGARASFGAALAEMDRRGRYLSPAVEGLVEVCGWLKLPEAELLPALGEAVDLTNPRWRQVIARVLLERGLWDAALAALEGVTDPEPGVLLAVGQAQLRQGEPELALAWFARIPAAAVERTAADWSELLAHAVAGRLTAARALLDDILAPRGEGEMVILHRALLAAWSGAEPLPPRFEHGLPALRLHVARILELFLAAGALELFERTVPALDWLTVPAVEQAALLGRLYQTAGLPDLAYDALLLALEAGDRTLPTLQSLGLLCLRRAQYNDAEELLREVLRQQQEATGRAFTLHNTALLGYLSALTAQGKHDEADPLWQELLQPTGGMTATAAG